MQTPAYSINFDADGQLINVTIDGKEAKQCSRPPEDEKRVLASWGEDPEGGDGMQIVQFSSSRCWLFFGVWYCF
jgi:hypothetical protein